MNGSNSPPFVKNDYPKTNEVIAISLIRMLIEVPEVSFIGSPTVSPITALWWGWLFLPITTPYTVRFPASIYFFALSHAPPVFEKEIAT